MKQPDIITATMVFNTLLRAQSVAITRRDFVGTALLLASADTASGWEAALPVAKLDHVNIHVPDVRRSAEFYGKLFGEEVSKTPKTWANPGSIPGELWFLRLGESHLSISPIAPQSGPGLDHFCLTIQGFDGLALKSKLTEFNQPWPNSTPKWVWLKDPDGHLIQIAEPADLSKPPGFVTGAVTVEAPRGAKREPAFQVSRITQLTLAVAKLDQSAGYYRKLLGQDAENPVGTFRVGQSELVLGPATGGDRFRVGIVGFDASAAAKKLKSLGVAADVLHNQNIISFSDPDGIKVGIGG